MIERIKNITVLEWVLFAAIFFVSAWLINPYLAKLLSVVLPPIFFSILIISLIADRLDPSKIGNKYYYALLFLSLVPLLIYYFFSKILQMQ